MVFKGAILHHYLLVHPIAHLPRDTGLGTYISGNGAILCVSASEVQACVQTVAIGDGLHTQVYSLDRIGSHSLRSGGATHLKMCACDELTIMKLGRWSSNTYLRYIQTQIGKLTKGLSMSLARILGFHNVS